MIPLDCHTFGAVCLYCVHTVYRYKAKTARRAPCMSWVRGTGQGEFIVKAIIDFFYESVIHNYIEQARLAINP